MKTAKATTAKARSSQSGTEFNSVPRDNKNNYRSLSLRLDGGLPATLDDKQRSVEVLAATEQPVAVWDWERGVIDEVLLMSGLEMPAGRQVVLLDTHSRYDTATVIGSFRSMAITPEGLVGRAHFSAAPEAQSPWLKVAEGHLTDFSVGSRVMAAEWLGENETKTIAGKNYTGPLRVVTLWKIRELSVCPIGADELAKARAEAPAPQHEENTMDPKLRAFLERRGLPKEATEQEAHAFLQRMESEDDSQNQRQAANSQGQPPADVLVLVNERLTAERQRVGEITALCDKHGCRELAATMIADGSSVDKARQAVLDLLAKTPAAAGIGHRAPAVITSDERDKIRAAATDAVMLRAGLAVATPSPGADELAGRSLVELSRFCLSRANLSDNGRPIEMVGRALLSSDLPVILGAIANKSLMEGWSAAPETWQIWCAPGSVPNFLTHKQARASEAPDLDEVPEGGEYEYGERGEAFESYAIATYGKIFAITRQGIINDDLGALTDVPFSHGEAAARKVGDVAYAVLTANAAMGDGIALFHSSHANLGSSGAISETTAAEAIKLMGVQKDVLGKRRLNINPQFYVAPKAVEGSSEIFFNSMQFATALTSATRANPYAGTRFVRIYEPRLDDASATAWYMAGPKGKTIKVFFLDGVQAPYLEQKTGWSVDGVEHKVRIDAAAKAMDWRGLIKNAG